MTALQLKKRKMLKKSERKWVNVYYNSFVHLNIIIYSVHIKH